MKIRIRLNESKKKEELYALEKAHFGGDLRDIGETLKFLVDTNKSNYGDIDTYAIDQALQDAGETKIKYVGEGAFRITYSYENDLVIKVAKTNTAKIMNEQDTELGRNTKYALLFPKVYMVDEPEYNWIVMEKCEPILDSDVFIDFFPNDFYKDLSGFTAVRVFQILLDYEANSIMREETNLYDLRDRLKYYAKVSLTDEDVKGILKQFDKTFHVLADMVAEYRINPQEIRPYNTGIAPDGRFVVIDSSIASAISKGLQSVP